MPLILHVKDYKFRFYEADLTEPPHVHVDRQGHEAKFWLRPVRLARAKRFRSVELREIERIIEANIDFLLEAWKQEQTKRDNR